MRTFARARQFRDISAVGLLSSKPYLDLLRDTVIARYTRFRAELPQVPISSDDPKFSRYVETSVGVQDSRYAEALARAFRELQRGDPDSSAAQELLAYLFLPPPSWAVDTFDYTFARYEGNRAVYYLTEVWSSPVVEQKITKRLVVEWFYSDKGWLLNQLRE